MEIVYHLNLCCRTEKIRKNLKDGMKETERREKGKRGATQFFSSPFEASQAVPARPSGGGTFQSLKLI
jgi:hypothetical protein